MTDEKKERTSYANDLSNGPSLALTKADHDRIVEAMGRPYTQDPVGSFRKGSTFGPHVPDESAEVPRARS